MPSLLNLSRIMIFNVHTWLPVTLFSLRPDQEIYRFNYSLMTSQLRRGGKKGQHIFENVNLNNVFWVCWKKPLSNAIWVQQHQASFSSLSFPWAMGIVSTCSTLRIDFSIVWSCYMRSHFTGGACLLGYVCTLYRYLSCTEKMFCCLTALLLYFLFISPRMQLCVCSYWWNFKMHRSAPIPLRANYMHITTAANS